MYLIPFRAGCRKPLERHLAVVLNSLPEAALHTVSEGPKRTPKIVENTVRSLRTNSPDAAMKQQRRAETEARTTVDRPTSGRPPIT